MTERRPFTRHEIVEIARKVREGERIRADLVAPFLDYTIPELSPFNRFMLRVAAWISLFFASVLVIFPEVGEWLISVLPGFFLLPERLAKALDYIWGLVGQPVKKQHLMYHVPNIIVYAFGAAGIRQLWRKIQKNNWKDLVADAQSRLSRMIDEGRARIAFQPGFSILFAGNGDQVAKSLVLDDPLLGPTLSSIRPAYTSLWARFQASEGDEGIERVMALFNVEEAGEYVLFPVVDDQLFLPGPTEYDMPPHRVEIAVRRIRDHEKAGNLDKKRIIIAGDAEQASRFLTAAPDGQLDPHGDRVTLRTIAEKYENVLVVDPTEVTLRRIVEIADGRRILFRASDQGTEKYARRFFQRLAGLGYEPTREDTLTVGYDISDFETEHQLIAQQADQYLPVILSRDVFDLLSGTYLRDGQFIFVPGLVKSELQRLVAET